MRRGLVHVLAWLLATGAAVTLSWWGVHTVMTGTAYDPPRALPIAAADPTMQRSRPLASSTHRAAASRTPSAGPAGSAAPTAPTATPSPPSKSAPATAEPSTGQSAATATADSRIKSYDTKGGRSVFDIADTYATLVSATPAAGWSMQVFKTETWIRVEFSAGTDRVSVFCTWHDGPPHVQVVTY
ncbi:hypothetical protein ACFV5G_39430 [Streptomyces sp. NPDC059766]|uniref:hypothetical protein n=1 Tax=Streptomyces sp. NPDC059766 TaxID=3346940 RepID=UPI00364F08D8